MSTLAQFDSNKFDVIIVGASFTGLTAALQLGRASQKTLVLDGGAPRNAESPAAHGAPGFDGRNPLEILKVFRDQLKPYPQVSIAQARAETIQGTDGAFRVELVDGKILHSKKIILATGLRDILPDLPGIKTMWGKSVLHCPYCHGYEVRGQRLGVMALHAKGAIHHAKMLHTDWSQDVVLFTHDREDIDPSDLAELSRRGIRIIHGKVQALLGEGDQLREVALENGERFALDAVFTTPPFVQASPFAEVLGCKMQFFGDARIVEVDPLTGATSVPGVYAGGDMTRFAHTVSFAIGDGARAGIMCHQSMIADPSELGKLRSSDK